MQIFPVSITLLIDYEYMGTWLHICMISKTRAGKLPTASCTSLMSDVEQSGLQKSSDSFICVYIKNQDSFYKHKIVVNHLLRSRQERICFKTKTTSSSCPHTLFSTQKATHSNQKTQGFWPASVTVKTGHKDGDWYNISTISWKTANHLQHKQCPCELLPIQNI